MGILVFNNKMFYNTFYLVQSFPQTFAVKFINSAYCMI